MIGPGPGANCMWYVQNAGVGSCTWSGAKCIWYAQMQGWGVGGALQVLPMLTIFLRGDVQSVATSWLG